MDAQSSFRGGTWQRYKLGQAQFTKWLKQTADKLIPTTTADGLGSSSSKSTASKKADKKAAKAGIESEVVVHWRELEVLASNIVDNARPEDIPSAPINILRDVIGLRKKSARFFSRAAASNGGEEDDLQDKNATHEHIIRVLERVLAKFEALKTKASGSTARPKEESGIRMDLNDLNNMFEHLEVQTSAEAAEQEDDSDVENQAAAPGKSSTRAKKGGKKKLQKGARSKKAVARVSENKSAGPQDSSWIDAVDFGLDDTEDEEFDYFMMIYCFFEDFNLIRSYICERWCDYYYDRSISLNTLAVITNAAFELFHQMEHDLVIDMRRMGIRNRAMGSYEFMMMAIFTESGMEHIEYDSYDSLSAQEADDRIYKDEWDWLASPAFIVVREILGHVPPGKTPLIRKSDRTLPKYGGTTAAELSKFKDAVINDLFFDVVCVKAHKKNNKIDAILPAESELLLGFQDSLRNYDWSSAFIFSLQLYVDIRFIMEDTVDHAFKHMQETASKAERTLLPRYQCAPSENRRVLRQRLKEIERFMLNDVVLEDKLPRYLNAGLQGEDVEPFYLLKHEPVWAGLLDLRAKIFMNEIGHEQVNRSPYPQTAAYLYTAAREAAKRFPEHLDFPVWDDMEKFIMSYSDDSLFKSGIMSAGDDPMEILRNSRAIVSAYSTGSEAHSTALDTLEGQTEDFKEAVRIRGLLSKRYMTEDRPGHFFMDYMQGLINQRLERALETLESQDVSSALTQISGNKPSAQPHSQGQLSEDRQALAQQRLVLKEKARAAQRKALLAQLSPIQQIQILEDTVNAQLDGLLSIDFLVLYRESLATLALALRDVLGMSYDAAQIVQVPLLLGEMLSGDRSKDEDLLRKLVTNVKKSLQVNSDSLGEQDEEDTEDDEDERMSPGSD